VVGGPLLSRGVEQSDTNNITSYQARPPTKHNGAPAWKIKRKSLKHSRRDPLCPSGSTALS
jgi:hypothetical protein